MSPGEWKGNTIFEENRTLILGESHYGDEEDSDRQAGLPVPYDTKDVVRAYYEHKISGESKARWDRFFDQIAGCFGYPVGKGVLLFNKVWFGNYVPVLCGIAKNNKAKAFMEANRTEYNNQLFKFVNENGIDTIVCFSKAAFWNMPKADDQDKATYREIELPYIGGRRNPLLYYRYAPVPHGACDIILNKPLTVYGIRHPSSQGGFRSEDVYHVLCREIPLDGLCYSPERNSAG